MPQIKRLFLFALLAITLILSFSLIFRRPTEEPVILPVNHFLPKAKGTRASELLSRPLTNQSTIPRIFHQSWKTADLPVKFQHWSNTCREQHLHWEWVIWTDQDNLRLVQQHFPWLEDTYQSLPGEIYRADFVRSLYMYAYGGVYADLDTECLLPTEMLGQRFGASFGNSTGPRAPTRAFFGRMGTKPDFEHSIPNAWMASVPGHPFFLQMAQESKRRFNMSLTKAGSKAYDRPERVTGPIALRDTIAQYESAKSEQSYRLSEELSDAVRKGPFPSSDQAAPHEVVLLPSEIIYPYSWGKDGRSARSVCWVTKNSFNPEKCKSKLGTEEKGSISITYWSHTHAGTGQNDKNMKHIEF